MPTANGPKKVASPDSIKHKKAAAVAATHTNEGTVVGITNNRLLLTNMQGHENSHLLAKDVTYTCDGVVCKPEDLKYGTKIRVTTQPDNRNVAIGIEALDKLADFAPGGS